MGQCFSWDYSGQSRAPASRTNRRFEYTPKKSWKYKDAHMMSQFQALSMDSGEEDGIQTREIAAGGQFSVGGMTSGSEDELYEIDLQNTRNSSKLVFTDEEELESPSQSPQHTIRSTIVNKGFQPLEDQSFDSPRIARLSSTEEDRVQLLDNEQLQRDGVT